MRRKTYSICALLAALGILAVVPAMASATTAKDTVNGVVTTLPVGAKIIADSTGTSEFVSGELTVKCNENILTGSVAKNDGKEIQGTIEAAWFQSNLNSGNEFTECSSNLGPVTVTIPSLTNGGGASHWCIRSVPGTDNFEFWGNNCGTAVGTGELKFTLDITNTGQQCTYKRSAAVKGSFTTNVGVEHKAAELKQSAEEPEFTLVSGILCPASGKLRGLAFDLYTDTEGPFSKTHSKHTFTGNPTEDPVFITNP